MTYKYKLGSIFYAFSNSLTDEYKKNKNKLKGRVENYENWLNNYVSCKFSYFKNSDTEFYPTIERKNILLPMSDVYYKKYKSKKKKHNAINDCMVLSKFVKDIIDTYGILSFKTIINNSKTSVQF